jgi:O-antigen/teichoic acid export membrane protein
MEKKLSVGQNTLFNSLGSLIYLGCQWLITILVVHLDSYQGAGTLSLAMSVTNLFSTLATFGLRDFQVSDFANQYAVSTYVTTRITTCCISMLLCIITVLAGGHYSSYQAACILVYMLFRLAEALVDCMQAIEQKAERMDFVCLSFLLRGVGILVVFCVALKLTGNLLLAFAGMAALSFAVVLGLDFPTAKRLTGLRLHFDFAQTRKLLWECAPLMCNSFAMTAIVSIPRSTLEELQGEYLLGIYASIATPAVIVQTAASWLYTPAITSFTRHYVARDKARFYGLYRRMWLIIAAAVAVTLVAAKLLGRWALGLLLTEEILDYTYLLIPVLLTTILIACNYFLSALLTITRHLKIILASNAVAMALVLLFSRALITAFSMSGVNYVIYLAMGVNVVILFTALTILLHRQFR